MASKAAGQLDEIAPQCLTLPGIEAKRRELPTFDELPNFRNFTGCAWGVWGPDDELGTVNLLTDEVVHKSASEEIQIGRRVCLNWPLNFPSKPMFGRRPPEVNLLQRVPGPSLMPRDDELHMNTQSGTQWDGLRHYGIVEHAMFYNNTPAVDLPLGIHELSDPNDIRNEHKKLGIQNWAQHGICGRGVLLDLVTYYERERGSLPYDPWTMFGITVPMLEEVRKAEGVQFRAGDILLLRVGFIRKYGSVGQGERDELREKPETFAGIEQSEDMKRFLWNNHFAAIASDQPALEVQYTKACEMKILLMNKKSWPAPPGTQMHQTILGLWGMPIGEFFDLEELSKVCAETGRYTFFFNSWPLNIIGGAASPANAAAIF